MSGASALAAALLAARPAGGKASKARRTIDFLAETHVLSDLARCAGFFLAALFCQSELSIWGVCPSECRVGGRQR